MAEWKFNIGRFWYETCRQKRICKICNEEIPRNTYHLVAYLGYNTCAIHTKHFNEEILNEIRLLVL